MKKDASILLLWFLFIGLSEEGYACREFLFISERDTTTKSVVWYFDENQSEVNESSANHGKALATLDSLFEQTIGKEDIITCQIQSYASPLGNTINNNRLALLRSESVRKFLQKRYLKIDASKVKLLSPDDGWTELRKLVSAEQNLPDREDVVALIDYHATNNAKRTELIKRVDKGIPYRYMVQQILPKFRKVEVAITWEDPVVERADVKVVVDATPDSCRKSDREGIIVRENDCKSVSVMIPATNEKKEQRDNTVLAIKNNLLYDVALAPNIEIEIPIGKKWSFNTEYKCPWWMNSRQSFCYQLLSGGVEARYWLGNRQKRNKLTGHFLGFYAEGGIYDFQFEDDKGYQGKYYGASGLTYGYTRQLARHFSLEFSLGVGYLTTEYKKYVPYKEDIVASTSGRYNFIGPTKLKISLVWLLTKRR